MHGGPGAGDGGGELEKVGPGGGSGGDGGEEVDVGVAVVGHEAGALAEHDVPGGAGEATALQKCIRVGAGLTATIRERE